MPRRRRRRRLERDARRPGVRAQLGQLGRARPPRRRDGPLGPARAPTTAPAPSTTRPCRRCWPGSPPSSRSAAAAVRSAWLSSAARCPRSRARWPSCSSPRPSCRRRRAARPPRAEGLVPMGEDGARARRLVEHAFRHAVVTTIYGGIQRGPPRDHRRAGPRPPPKPLEPGAIFLHILALLNESCARNHTGECCSSVSGRGSLSPTHQPPVQRGPPDPNRGRCRPADQHFSLWPAPAPKESRHPARDVARGQELMKDLVRPAEPAILSVPLEEARIEMTDRNSDPPRPIPKAPRSSGSVRPPDRLSPEEYEIKIRVRRRAA